MAVDTRGSLKAEVLALVDETGDTGTTATIVNNALAEAHHQRCTSEDWDFMKWPVPVTFSLVANQRLYTLHPDYQRPLYVFNRTTKEYLIETPLRQLEASTVRWNDDTTGNRFWFVQPSPLSTQPSSASTISIVSSSASDTGASYAVTIRGDTTNGVREEAITPTGTSTATGTISFRSPILMVTLEVAWNGTLTVSAGATTLLTLPAGELGRMHPQMELAWLPQSADTIEYRFCRKPK